MSEVAEPAAAGLWETWPEARAIVVRIELGGGSVRIEVNEPTRKQVAAVHALVDDWLSGEAAASPFDAAVSAAATAHTPDVPDADEIPAAQQWSCDQCGAGPFERPQALGAHRRYKHGAPAAKRTAAPAAKRTAAPAAEPEQVHAAAPAAEPEQVHAEPTENRTTTAAAASIAVLCRCSHGERMHERDELVGRGACHHGSCGCSEYQAN